MSRPVVWGSFQSVQVNANVFQLSGGGTIIL
jgi:hypothetical protein